MCFNESVLIDISCTYQEFRRNFAGDPQVKIPWVREDLSGPRILTMEWIDGIRCTSPKMIREKLNEREFIECGVKSGLRQLLEFGFFHGDPHPGSSNSSPTFFTSKY